MKVSVRLVNVADNKVLWTSAYDRELKDVFAVQEEMARAIVGALSTQLAASSANVQLVDRPTTDLAAYELYSQGQFYSNQRSRDGLPRAIGLYQRAIERDPKYALAYVGLGDAYVTMANFDFMPAADALPRARAAAERAVALDDHLAAAQASYGFVLASQGEFAPADAAFRRAIALQPSYVLAHHFYSLLLVALGNPGEATEQNRLALESDRLAPNANTHRAVLYCLSGDYERRDASCNEHLPSRRVFSSRSIIWESWRPLRADTTRRSRRCSRHANYRPAFPESRLASCTSTAELAGRERPMPYWRSSMRCAKARERAST